MINLYDLGQVYIVCGRTNMRRGIDGLAAIVKDKFDLDPEKYLKYLLYSDRQRSTVGLFAMDKASAGKLQINFEYN